MGWILRTSDDKVNPTLPGGVYGKYITAGRPVYWRHDSGANKTYFILFIADGGRYGMHSVSEVSYQGGVIPSGQYVFHPGKYTKQIQPKLISSVDDSGNQFTSNNHGLSNGWEVRLSARDGVLPSGITNNQKYFIVNAATNTFQLSLTSGGSVVDIANQGSGEIRVWRANAGKDDPSQGIPTHCPEVNVTFSGICYVEGWYSTTLTEEPAWQDFRIIGLGRNLMDYNSSGAETGIVTDTELLSNPALILADIGLVEYKKPISRFDWVSWKQFRDAAFQKIWQKSTSNLANGLIGEYFNWVNGVPVFENPIILRADNNIDFSSSTLSPAPGISNEYFTIKWTGLIQVPYSETFTFSVYHDDTAKIYIDNQLVINGSGVGTHSGSIYLQSGKKYPITIEFTQVTGPWHCQLYWQSTSQSYQIIPTTALFIADIGVPRYMVHTAFPQPTEATDVFERVMDRCPGWNWTDKNGKIIFLPPNRPTIYEFIYDSSSPDIDSTILDGQFEAKKRSKREKPNFALYEVRDVQQTGFPTIYVEADRPQLREFGNTTPDNNEPIQLGVMTRSQGERIAELEMVFKSDAKNTYEISGDRSSGVVSKAERVKITHYVGNNKKVADLFALVTGLTRQATKLDFSLLPIPFEFYKDELYIPPTASGSGGSGGSGGGSSGGSSPSAPTGLSISYSPGNSFANLFWTNHSALGEIIIERDYNGNGFVEIARLADYTLTSWSDYSIYVTGTYTYRVSNTAVTGYAGPDGFYAYFGGGGGYGGGGDGPCFLAGTRVLCEGFIYRNIEEIQVDDYVMAFDERGKIQRARVTETFTHKASSYRKFETRYATLNVTSNHLILDYTFTFRAASTYKEYCNSFYLGNNFTNWLLNNIISNEEVILAEETTVYNLEVEQFHTYIAEGVPVHNLKPLAEYEY